MPDESALSTQSHPAPVAGWFSMLDRSGVQTVLLGIIAGVLILAALDGASLIAVPTVLAVLCAIALAPSVRWLERTGAPASLCAALVVGGLLLGAAFTAYSLAPSAEAWNARAPQILRETERRAREIASGMSRAFEPGPEAAPAVVPNLAEPSAPVDPPGAAPGAASDDDTVGRLVEGGQRLLADWAIGAPRIAAGAAFWAMLTFFLLRDRVMLARWGMSLVSGASARRAVGRAMRDVRTNVARYLLAISAINLGLGFLTAVSFHLLGVSNAPLWGVAAMLLNFMPFIGVAILALITLGVGIVSFEDPVVAFAPFAVVVVLNMIEAQVVTPMVVGARIRISPIAVFVAIAFGAWIWGAGGALVATPTLIVAVAFVGRLNAAAHPSRPARHREGRQKGGKRQ
ncbi:MAG: AI-2E family transporter [Rhodobacteraceae bacterium]|nr:AI-2E family transporter [Paracoccaceae bacterium]